VEPVDEDSKAIGPAFIAIDTVGAGYDEVVLVVESREATLAFDQPDTPTDMGIIGIVDEIKNGDNLNKIR
jgi:ethanolamine utilization protein EutN